MLIAFKHYKADPDVTSWVIRQWTNSPFVHVELVLESLHNTVVAARTSDDGVWFYPFEEMIQRPEYFEFYRVPGVNETEVIEFLRNEAGKSFNWPAVLGRQGLGINLFGRDRWFCSELAYYVLVHYSTLGIPRNYDPKSLSPGQLRDLVAAADVERVPSSEFGAALPVTAGNAPVIAAVLGAITAINRPVVVQQPPTLDTGAAFEKMPVSVNLAAEVENDVPFAWNGRKLFDYQFVDADGEELPDQLLTKTSTGFTVVTNQAFSGKVYLFLFRL